MSNALRWLGMVIFFSQLVPAVCRAETSLTRLRQEAGRLLTHEATVDDEIKKHDAATALSDMYVVLRSDSRYGSSEMLQGTAAKVRRRLLTIKKRTENRLKREGVARPRELSRQVDQAIEQSMSEDHPEQRDVGGGAALDDGWRLVELIERVVAPDFWDNVGGPGSIHYFAMRRILVVRATSDVHQQIKDLLTAIR